VEVDFRTFSSAVDALGGIPLSLTAEEAESVSRFLPAGVPGPGASAGEYVLNGAQVLSFVRNRSSSMGDFDRTQRQRRILSALMERWKNASVAQLFFAADAVLPYLETNLPGETLLYFLRNAGEYFSFSRLSVAVPAQGTFRFDRFRGMEIIRWNRKSNILHLYQTIYGEV